MVCEGFRKCHTENEKISDCADCLTNKEQSNPTVKEKGVSYTIENPEMYSTLIYHVDDGLITGTEEIKCDYLLMFPQQMQSIFVELKRNGSDWEDAVNQVENTIRLLLPDMDGYIPHLRAAFSRNTPNIKSPQKCKREKDFKKKYGRAASFRIGERLRDNINTL
jgi:hypothetical protein